MLSILIPVYNFNSRPLLESLHSQAEALNIEYEIVVADDASTLCKEEIAGIPSLLCLQIQACCIWIFINSCILRILQNVKIINFLTFYSL